MASPEHMDESQALLREALEEKGEGQGGPLHLGRPTPAGLPQRSENPLKPLEQKKGLFLWLMQEAFLGCEVWLFQSVQNPRGASTHGERGCVQLFTGNSHRCRQESRMLELAQWFPTLTTSELPQGHVKK